MSMLRHLKAWLRRGRLDDELREELAQHVAWKTDSLIADGVPEREARRRAGVEVGNLRACASSRARGLGLSSIDSVVQDARYGLPDAAGARRRRGGGGLARRGHLAPQRAVFAAARAAPRKRGS
jgi:hypothetical protein